MKLNYAYIITILLIIGCSRENITIQPSTDLERYILNLPEVEVSIQNVDIDREHVSSILRIENSIPDKIILIDYNIWSIFMAKKDGTLLDRKGGIGRGPGEFQLINDLYTYIDENMLQVLDKKSKRLTYYSITEDSLELSHTVPLPNYGQYYLQTVFKSNGKTIGIFRVLRQYENMEVENKLYVYSLDEGYNLKEKIHEIEGSELIKVKSLNGDTRPTENVFGNDAVWSFNKGKLYYANAKNLNLKVFNIENKTISEYIIPNIPKYINTPETIEYMMDKYSMMFSIIPEYESYFKQRKTLPYFNNIYAGGKYLYIPIAYYGSEYRYVLRFNLETAQLERINIPTNFYMEGVNQSGIYGKMGVDDYNEMSTIAILEFQ